MGCGSSIPAAQNTAPPESQQNNVLDTAAAAKSSSTPSQKLQRIPLSSMKPVEFGLVTGLEYGDKTAPALLVVQVLLLHSDKC